MQKCCYCEIELLPSETRIPVVRKPGAFNLYKADVTFHPQARTREHLWPKHKGPHPLYQDRNKTLDCCFRCNNEKSHLTLQEFIEKLKKAQGNEVKILNAEKLIQKYQL